ncbi:polyglutamine-binding protein 1-like [Gigantopelta aegis]|uniref:polyglutamine-binding protein 1-like n=1 Tax=Gigantopelta aegis TaxID=1735272 RepID=UPI001B888D77|nr:polyglutamine-binding protein 1-like [Gigantopelta aegis]
MPLPAALAARLAKRGLVKAEERKPPQKPEEVEEVFAEDYDDPSNPEPAPEAPLQSADVPPSQVTMVHITPDKEPPTTETLIFETINCPNKWNPYHKCVTYCRTHWGVKEFLPEPVMLKRRDRHLRKYPLPDGWIEVADPKTGRYYYWSITTDQVSWLSPLHPKSTITLPADRLQAMLDSSARVTLNDKVNEEEQMDMESDLSDMSSSESSSEDERERRRDHGRDRRYGRGNQGDKKVSGNRRSKEDTLDPMDPASYSDIPRGSWSDGLDQRGKAKTGVDVTASGPLFQQRPYPSPGDVLRANREMSEKK